jgi:hypothetical protein
MSIVFFHGTILFPFDALDGDRRNPRYACG